MQKILTALFIFIGVVSHSVQAEMLTLKVGHLRSFKGNLMIFLWNNPDAYLMKNAADYRVIVDLEKPENTQVDGMIKVTIDDVPPGAYAMMLYHDENRSYDFERNFIGIPMEGFAFGNNAQPKLGAPKFQEAAINLGHTAVVQQVNVMY
ncbi:MAG: DUF2141 domain-containing protein [Alphaproteobacteria bacterium]|nr:DUF2141 domain-containing protein [Alphaproteobacteria bacterium]